MNMSDGSGAGVSAAPEGASERAPPAPASEASASYMGVLRRYRRVGLRARAWGAPSTASRSTAGAAAGRPQSFGRASGRSWSPPQHLQRMLGGLLERSSLIGDRIANARAQTVSDLEILLGACCRSASSAVIAMPHLAHKRRVTRASCGNRAAPRGGEDERKLLPHRSCACRAGEGQETVERARARPDRVDLAVAMARLLRTCLGQASVGMTVPVGAASAVIIATSMFSVPLAIGRACRPPRTQQRMESLRLSRTKR